MIPGSYSPYLRSIYAHMKQDEDYRLSSLPFRLTNCSAGQPISLCRQNRQAHAPRMNPLPGNARTARVTTTAKRTASNLRTRRMIP